MQPPLSDRSGRFLKEFTAGMLPQPAEDSTDLEFSWRVLRKMLHEPDPRFVGYRANRREERAFRILRFRIYWQALHAAKAESRLRMDDAITSRAATRAGWNFRELIHTEVAFYLTFAQLRLAGLLFILRSEHAVEHFDHARLRLVESCAF
jgi:hypothetical protein